MKTKVPFPGNTDVRNSDKLYMLVATGTRLALSLATFVVVVRFLGVVEFGVYATCVAVASAVAALTDYGLQTASLRDASMQRDRSRKIIGDALASKMLLSAVAAIAVGTGAFFFLTGDRWIVLLLILGGMLAFSYADLVMTAARVNRRYDIEAKTVLITSILMFIVVAGTAAFARDLIAVAFAFAATRLLYVIATHFALSAYLERWRAASRNAMDIWQTLRGASAYAVDSILTKISGQIDVLVLSTLLTLAEIGIYQAGARLTQVIVPFSVMLSAVYVPAMSASLVQGHAGSDFRTLSGRLTAEFFLLSIVSAAFFAFAGPLIATYVYGPQFDALNALWPGFAVYAMFRVAAAGYGIQLVALGKVGHRVASQIISLGSFLLASFVIVPRYGLNSTSWVMVTMGLSAFLVLGISLWRTKQRHPAVPASFLAVLLIGSATAALS